MKLGLFVIALTFAQVQVSYSKCGCGISYKVVGCYHDKMGKDRALPDELINERDVTNPAYNGFYIDWKNWNEYLPAFTCRCAEAAAKKGYKYFGLQFWAECWGGPSPDADQNFDKYGKDDDCYGPSYKKCNTKIHENCVGTNKHNFVYEIVRDDFCPVHFERLGCFKDKGRPLPEYILSERDPSVSVYNNINIDWWHFDTYLPELACRCAQKALSLGHDTFGMQYYGECWSGPNAYQDYYKNGSSNACVNKCYGPCENTYEICVGKNYANYAYRIMRAGECELETTALGCYNPSAVFSKMVITDVDPNNKMFMGVYAQDPSNWSTYIRGLTCRCARKTRELGYKAFAFTNKGECWTGPQVHVDYNAQGSSSECYTYQGDEEIACTAGGPLCTSEKAMYVHKIVTP